ncbi:MAG: flagellar biosynthesis protein FlgJ [Rhizobiales bacterium]|nr:flagellar biosynthesis protein FlgJ [Hyphomicrobiales bacterium]
MSISPPGDIVLDVLRASDPVRQQAATQKLSRIAEPVIRPTAATPERASFETKISAMQGGYRANLAGAGRPAANSVVGSAHRQFETLILKDFVQRMLPAEAEATFGEGTAGSIWKSWMADAVATEVAKSGGVGISNMLEPAPVAQQAKLTAPTNVAEQAQPISQPQVVVGPVEQPSGLSGFVAKLQEIFLGIFGDGRSAAAAGENQQRSRPAFDV